jgi:SWI/SNF related-matrix-associated actin-dependent regulator of chromatin subfamily C
MIIDSTDTEKKDSNEKEENALPAEKQNSPSSSPKDHQESDNKNVSCDDKAPLVEPKSNNVEESGDPIPLVDKNASSDTEGSLSTKDSVVPQDNANGCGLLASQEAVAGSTTVATNPEEDKPSSEVEPDDDSSANGKIELSKTEDAVATPTIVQEDEKSQTLGDDKIEGTSFIFSLYGKSEIISRNQRIVSMQFQLAFCVVNAYQYSLIPKTSLQHSLMSAAHVSS